MSALTVELTSVLLNILTNQMPIKIKTRNATITVSIKSHPEFNAIGAREIKVVAPGQLRKVQFRGGGTVCE